MKRFRVLSQLLLPIVLTGCISQLRDEFDDARVAMFNHNLAWAAYCEASPLYCTMSCPHSFKMGFKSGFIAMANGANGCPPVFPPSSKILSLAWLDDGTPEDRRNAWYDGYSHGVLAAHQTGAVDINRIPGRLPTRQNYDLTNPGGAPSEYLPLAPSPSPVPLDSPLPGIPPTPSETY